jgi:hypothetical protein
MAQVRNRGLVETVLKVVYRVRIPTKPTMGGPPWTR